MLEKFRDPIHGFIEVRPLEKKIVDSQPFQRLRNIKQLAMTNLVYHGAEHTRFGHSLGVMHLASKSFRSVLNKNNDFISVEKQDWYEQILRLIALTHDLGHAPFSHASELVFPEGQKHEDFTEKIIMETVVGEFISEIGKEYVNKYGERFNITPKLICDIYAGREAGENSEFIFLKSFMDSELDCDKMDYLLRDSHYCGVNYGKYDIERLISSLTVYINDDFRIPRLAIKKGGVQSFEEFVLARYFMFVQVYFHRTRRFFDIMLAEALMKLLPDGKYPTDVHEYLKWDDCKVMELIKEKCDEIEYCKIIHRRNVYPTLLETKTHPEKSDIQKQTLIKMQVTNELNIDNFIEDHSVDKMPHKILKIVEIDDEKAIVIINQKNGEKSTIWEESHIIKNLAEKINIIRIYVKPDVSLQAIEKVRKIYADL